MRLLVLECIQLRQFQNNVQLFGMTSNIYSSLPEGAHLCWCGFSLLKFFGVWTERDERLENSDMFNWYFYTIQQKSGICRAKPVRQKKKKKDTWPPLYSLLQKFCCNRLFFKNTLTIIIFLLLLKILYYNKKYCWYNLLQQIFCCNRLP